MTDKELKYLNIALDILIELQGTVENAKLDSGVDILLQAMADEENNGN